MFTPEDAMRQAHQTADLYAHEAARKFEDIFRCPPEVEPEAAALFIAQYMRCAAHDFDVAMRERGKQET